MNTKNLAFASAFGTVAVVALLFAYPAIAASAPSPQTADVQQLFQQSQDRSLQKVQLTVGQNITIASVAGGYKSVGEPSVNGTAAGSLTLQVIGAFTGGYALSTTGGAITINGTTYDVSAGSAELGPYGVRMVGQGQLGASAQFLFTVLNLGRFGSADYGVLRVDLTTGSSEFAARLLVTISA
jgi:hypothetical protein